MKKLYPLFLIALFFAIGPTTGYAQHGPGGGGPDTTLLPPDTVIHPDTIPFPPDTGFFHHHRDTTDHRDTLHFPPDTGFHHFTDTGFLHRFDSLFHNRHHHVDTNLHPDTLRLPDTLHFPPDTGRRHGGGGGFDSLFHHRLDSIIHNRPPDTGIHPFPPDTGRFHFRFDTTNIRIFFDSLINRLNHNGRLDSLINRFHHYHRDTTGGGNPPDTTGNPGGGGGNPPDTVGNPGGGGNPPDTTVNPGGGGGNPPDTVVNPGGGGGTPPDTSINRGGGGGNGGGGNGGGTGTNPVLPGGQILLGPNPVGSGGGFGPLDSLKHPITDPNGGGILSIAPIVPNPLAVGSNATLTVNLKSTATISANVYDATGMLVEQIAQNASVPMGANSFTISGAGLKQGIYIVIVQSGNEVVSSKLLVQ